jgi:Domain of unknown function DUF29
MAEYDRDFYAWMLAQAEALRAKDWRVLDLEHLAEEIEALGRSDRRALQSQLRILLLHLLTVDSLRNPSGCYPFQVLTHLHRKPDRGRRHGQVSV